VVTTDLFFTLLTAAGLSAAADQPADGVDLSKLLRDPAANLGRETLHWHYPHYYETTTPVSAIRTRDWKLLEYFEDGRLELFDLANDPTESRDLAATQPEKAMELKGRLAAWRERVDAKLPRPNPQFRSKQ
jgi:arylsulfatase A-like enzyme